MTIKIDSISVNHIGPVGEFKKQLSKINLIYGKNEQGKTFIAEYLLSTIFKVKPTGRSAIENGQINISGLEPGISRFSPTSKQKIEDLVFDPHEKNLPDLSRLSVVKGGDLSFETGNRNSVSFQIIKGYLSDQKTIEKVAELINKEKSILKCSVVDGDIQIKDRMGEVKTMLDLKEKIQDIDKILYEITQNSTTIEINQLTDHQKALQNELESQNNARRYHGYVINQELTRQNEEINKIPSSLLSSIKTKLTNLENEESRLIEEKKGYEKDRTAGSELTWLEKADREFERASQSGSGSTPVALLVFFILSLMIIPLSIFFEIPYLPYIFSLISIFLAIFLFSAKPASQNAGNDRSTREKILIDYGNKFGNPHPSIASLKTELARQSKASAKAEAKAESINNLTRSLTTTRDDVKISIEELKARTGLATHINIAKIQELEIESEGLDRSISKLNSELINLKLTSSEYSNEISQVTFDIGKWEALERDLSNTSAKLDELKKKSDSLRLRACEISTSSYDTPLNQVIDDLRTVRSAKEIQLVTLRAKIFAYLSIKSVIEEKTGNENEIIQQTFSSTGISSILEKITSKYNSVFFEENNLTVTDGIQFFPLSELSTGTQEQVLLAIRLGLLNHVLKGRKSFLILDDAFQHSDWDRRENLVDILAGLAQDGWQILYFTMDDHIKSLFEERLKPQFAEDYQLIDLGAI